MTPYDGAAAGMTRRKVVSPRASQWRRWTGAQVALALLLAACGSTPKESFYTLSAPPPVEANTATTLSIVVGPVTIPEAVDRTPMVIRTGPNQVDIADFHRWAEPLKAAIPRVLAAHLARLVPGARVSASRQASGSDADYRVTVELTRFESSFADGATVEAAWTVAGKGQTVRGRTLAREAPPTADHAGVAAAHSRALEKLASEIALTFQRLSSPRASARGG